LIDQARKRSAAAVDEIRPNLAQDASIAKVRLAIAKSPVREAWQRTHFPNINIVGLPKAGTSHLYQILSGHDELRPFHRSKEWCFHDLNKKLKSIEMSNEAANKTSYEKRLLNTLEGVNRIKEGWPSRGNRTVNGCLDLDSVLKQRDYLSRVKDKFVLLLRDPADWLWAAYNFWHFQEHEDAEPPIKYDWASAPNQYRSPELFHEYMLSGGRMWAARDLLAKFRDGLAARTPQLLRHVVSPENLLVLKTEDFAPDVISETGVLEKLATFLEISLSGFDQNVTERYTNCGDNKGTETVCKEASSAYKISGYRGMFEETRDLVYLQFAQECKYWAEAFNVVYDDCLDVGEKYLAPSSDIDM
jgi:hypothetical protein